ncbi:MAG: phosphoglycerate dehydrogenase [Chloroflexi bacterium]|nr:phosphoglycerate dehydrogenase [Chloroflexota bacterium]
MAWNVLVTEPIDNAGLEVLRQYATVDVKTGLTPEELKSIIGGYYGLIVRSQTKVTAEIIAAGSRLQVIGRAGVGVDNIDLEAATRSGIIVVNAPLGNAISAAEHTLALLLALSRHIPQANATLRAGEWRRANFMGTEVRHKTLGIIGLGQVGTEVARRAKGLEMNIIAHDPFVSYDYARNLGVELVSKEELLRQSDFISLHVSLTAATKGMIGRKELAMVKPTAYLINTARGGIVDEAALYAAVEEGQLAGAALDVFSQEPPSPSQLPKSDKIIVTPHLGASTVEAQTTVAVDLAQQIIAVLDGQLARYAVNAPFIPPETLAMVRPFLEVATKVGRLCTQLVEGQLGNIIIKYDGDIANYDTTALKAATICGLMEPVTEGRVNLINASVIAAQRGLRITEQKGTVSENYGSLITVEVATSAGVTAVAGTLMRDRPYVVKVNDYWIEFEPSPGYWLFNYHRDRPGLIGAVGTILGNMDINIGFMQVSRLQARGSALMILGLDEPLAEEQRQQILALPEVYTVKVVKL